MDNLIDIAVALLRDLRLTSAQAAVVNAGSESRPKFLVLIFDKRSSVRDIKEWKGIPVEIVRSKPVHSYRKQCFKFA